MTVKVISKFVSIFPLTIICGHCKSTLEVESVRDTEGHEEGMLCNTETVYGVTCPVCKNFAKAPESKQLAIRNERDVAWNR